MKKGSQKNVQTTLYTYMDIQGVPTTYSQNSTIHRLMTTVSCSYINPYPANVENMVNP